MSQGRAPPQTPVNNGLPPDFSQLPPAKKQPGLKADFDESPLYTFSSSPRSIIDDSPAPNPTPSSSAQLVRQYFGQALCNERNHAADPIQVPGEAQNIDAEECTDSSMTGQPIISALQSFTIASSSVPRAAVQRPTQTSPNVQDCAYQMQVTGQDARTYAKVCTDSSMTDRTPQIKK